MQKLGRVAVLGVCMALFLSASAWAYDPIAMVPQTMQQAGLMRDYDIVYVRSPRTLPCTTSCPKGALWAEFGHPYAVNPGTDLILLRPNGTEEVLVAGGPGAVQDPYVSFDGQTVFYTHFHNATVSTNTGGADIYSIHVPSRTITRLTQQQWAHPKGLTPQWGVYNMHPCPVPRGKVAFVSNRNGYLPPPESYPDHALQLHMMDEDGSNIETIGPMNLGSALHPTMLTDGRIGFSSLENMGIRRAILWGLWSIYPDGTQWGPVVSAFFQASGAHFMTQLSNRRIVWELYYNQNQAGFGTLFAQPLQPPIGEAAFGPANLADSRNPRFVSITGKGFQMPFTPSGMELLTPWATGDDIAALPSIDGDLASPRIGKVTHPSGAPDNHLLVVWSPGPIGGTGGSARELGPKPRDSGLYMIRNGAVTQSPDELILIKNDVNYNEQWPRALVAYKRIYGVDAPAVVSATRDIRLEDGEPFGLIGTSSVYKRESAPLGAVDGVTAAQTDWRTGGAAPTSWHWDNQGSDAGRYSNSEIHALRILTFEPNVASEIKGNPYMGKSGIWYPHYANYAGERLRVLGEIPLRKYDREGQPILDPDGNPDTSFLAKIPADVAFTFQTLDKDGMVLNMAQTWHQVRPGEARFDCGGCHAHSQAPTLFEETVAGHPDFVPIDLTGVGIARSYTREQHVPGGVPVDFADKAQVIPFQSRCSPALWLLRGEQKDCPNVAPLPPETVLSDRTLTPQELRDMAALIDTGACHGPACTLDDQRPTLVLAEPAAGVTVGPLTRVLVGMHDYESNLDMGSFSVVLNGTEIANTCQPLPDWRWQCVFNTPIETLTQGTLVVSVKDQAGNRTRIDRRFSVQAPPPVPHLTGTWTTQGTAVTCTLDGSTAQIVFGALDACLQ